MKTAWCLQQVPFEGPGVFQACLQRRGYSVHQTVVPTQGLPQGQIDVLLIMGGPMSVNDPDPWIAQELEFVRRAIAGGIPTLGVCFGSQLLASALGGAVAPGPTFEIGMVPVTLTHAGKTDPIFRALPDTFPVFQWHGEGIKLGSKGVPLVTSSDFPVQAFRYEAHIYGLLFHPEIEQTSISVMCQECPQDVFRGGTCAEVLAQKTAEHLPFLHELANRVIDHLTSLPSPRLPKASSRN
ncbi:MAG: type 1 glutamine amidotransferase [Nitrospirales bacterium]